MTQVWKSLGVVGQRHGYVLEGHYLMAGFSEDADLDTEEELRVALRVLSQLPSMPPDIQNGVLMQVGAMPAFTVRMVAFVPEVTAWTVN